MKVLNHHQLTQCQGGYLIDSLTTYEQIQVFVSRSDLIESSRHHDLVEFLYDLSSELDDDTSIGLERDGSYTIFSVRQKVALDEMLDDYYAFMNS